MTTNTKPSAKLARLRLKSLQARARMATSDFPSSPREITLRLVRAKQAAGRLPPIRLAAANVGWLLWQRTHAKKRGDVALVRAIDKKLNRAGYLIKKGKEAA